MNTAVTCNRVETSSPPNIFVDDDIRKRLGHTGWQLAGFEASYTSGNGQIRTEAEITSSYIYLYGHLGYDEVHVEPAHTVATGDLDPTRLYVYMRRVRPVSDADL